MAQLFDDEFIVEQIVFAMTVPNGAGKASHRDRGSHGFVLGIGGAKEYSFIGGKKLFLHDGEVLSLPRHSDYDVRSLDSCIAINFLLNKDEKNEPFVVRTSENILELFRNTEKAWLMKKPGYMLKCLSLLYEIAHLVFCAVRPEYLPSKNYAAIEKAVGHIRNNYLNEKIRVSDLARTSGMSEVYFRKQFQKAFGTPPLKFINRLKLEHAAELLNSKLHTVSETAFLCGFENDSYFSREFKKAYGVPPSEYTGIKKHPFDR